MSNRRVLITGASGWTGVHLAKLVIDTGSDAFGTIFNGVGMSGVHNYRVDLTDQVAVDQVVLKTQPDWVFHLAAIVPKYGYPSYADEIISVNVTGTYNILNSVKNHCPDARVLISGSSGVYGGSGQPDNLIVDEDSPLQPMSLYATTKVCQEMLAQQFFAQSDLFTVRARVFNQVGPGEGTDRVCGQIAKQIASIEAGLCEPLLKVQSIMPRRDFTDIRDVVSGYWEVLGGGIGGDVYNICSGISYSVNDVITTMMELSTVKGIDVIETDPVPASKDLLNQVGSSAKLNQITGWYPRISLEESLKDLLEDWRVRVLQS